MISLHVIRCRTAEWIMRIGMWVLPDGNHKIALYQAYRIASDMMAFECRFEAWLYDNRCDHGHCVEDESHSQVFFAERGELLCGECAQQGRRSAVVPCTNHDELVPARSKLH